MPTTVLPSAPWLLPVLATNLTLIPNTASAICTQVSVVMTFKVSQWLTAAMLLAAATAAVAASKAEYAHPDSYAPDPYDKGYKHKPQYDNSHPDYGYGGDKVGLSCFYC